MDLHGKTFTILFLCAFTLLVNLPFGHARAKAERYSLRWFLYIHIPIPLIFIGRAHIEFKYIPVLVLAAIAGQIVGGKLEL
jgi:hypothetical protein